MAITNGYCTLVEIKAALRLNDNTDDTLLENAVEGASRRVDGYTGRWFYKTTSTALGHFALDAYNVPTRDIANTTVTVKTDDNGDGVYETTWTQGTDYQLYPLVAALDGLPYNRVVAVGAKSYPIFLSPSKPLIEITAEYGWNAVPDDIREATILLAMRGFARLNAALGVVGFADMAIQVRAVDPDVRDLLNPFRIIAVA